MYVRSRRIVALVTLVSFGVGIAFTQDSTEGKASGSADASQARSARENARLQQPPGPPPGQGQPQTPPPGAPPPQPHPPRPAPPADESRVQDVSTEAAAASHVAVIPLAHATAEDVLDPLLKLRPAFGRLVLFSSDPRTNALIVAADSEAAIGKIRELVAQLDQEAKAPEARRASVYRAVPLKTAVARDVVHYLQVLMPRMPAPSVRVVADEHANTIWLAGDAAEVEATAAVARQMDENAATATASPHVEQVRELRFYALEHADAARLAGSLAEVAKAMAGVVRVVPDEASGMLLVYATPADHEQIQDIIARLDVTPKRPPARAQDDSRGEKD